MILRSSLFSTPLTWIIGVAIVQIDLVLVFALGTAAVPAAVPAAQRAAELAAEPASELAAEPACELAAMLVAVPANEPST